MRLPVCVSVVAGGGFQGDAAGDLGGIPPQPAAGDLRRRGETAGNARAGYHGERVSDANGRLLLPQEICSRPQL